MSRADIKCFLGRKKSAASIAAGVQFRPLAGGTDNTSRVCNIESAFFSCLGGG